MLFNKCAIDFGQIRSAQHRRLLDRRLGSTSTYILDWVLKISKTHVGRIKNDTNSNHLRAWWLCGCVPIAIPSIFLCCLVLVVLIAAISSNISSSRWKPMTVRKERDGKPRTRVGWEVAVITDGRKECCCRLTRSKCHRCKTGIPSVFENKHIKAMSLKSRSWSESSS